MISPKSRAVLAFALALTGVMFVGGDAVLTQGRRFFETGQPADLLLSGYGFNKTGGARRFNHPAGVAIVGGSLVLADRNNNRVLIWSGLPDGGDVPPAVVLGQSSFDTNAAGSGLDGFDWPTAVATDGRRLYVGDAYNHRVLVWRMLPTSNKQPADFALTEASGVHWPWGIWTNGQKLLVSATDRGRVLVWNEAPDSDRAADMELQPGDFGTPRAIESDGTRLLVSDHNAVNNGRNPGNFFWNAFPATTTTPYSFFVKSTPAANAPANGTPYSEHIHDAEIATDGQFLAIFNKSLCVWASFPTSASDVCATVVSSSGRFSMDAGDNSGIAVSNGRVFVSLNNGNRVVVYNSVPSTANQVPDYAIGSPDIYTNTLDTDAIITNPVPLTDGESLWVSSDYDKRLHVWRRLPERDAQPPDYTYRLDFQPWANARVGNGFALAGQSTLMMWNAPPTGQPADTVLRESIGSATLSGLRGVAYDGTWFTLASYEQNRVWVWRGVPTASSFPVATIEIAQPGRVSSDGRYLAVSIGGPSSGVVMYDLAQVTTGNVQPVTIGRTVGINLPQDVTLAHGALFIADTNGNRVLAWRDTSAAFSGASPDAVLGAKDLVPRRRPAIGQDTLFWPGAVDFDGTRLWVGEFKFGNRLLRFTR